MWSYMGENQCFNFFVLVRNCVVWCFGCTYICSFAPMATRNAITPAVKEIITQLKEHLEEHYDGVVSRLCDQTIWAHECIEQRWQPLLLFFPRNNVCACFPVVKTRFIYVNTFFFFVTCQDLFKKLLITPLQEAKSGQMQLYSDAALFNIFSQKRLSFIFPLYFDIKGRFFLSEFFLCTITDDFLYFWMPPNLNKRFCFEPQVALGLCIWYGTGQNRFLWLKRPKRRLLFGPGAKSHGFQRERVSSGVNHISAVLRS